MEFKLKLIVVICNNGYSDEIMKLSKEVGARGGTILNGTGSIKPEAEKIYGLTINPEKEVVLITIKEDLVDEVLKVLYEKAGNNSDAKSIAFSLPIEHATSNLYKQYELNTEE